VCVCVCVVRACSHADMHTERESVCVGGGGGEREREREHNANNVCRTGGEVLEVSGQGWRQRLSLHGCYGGNQCSLVSRC
jgi:hypothetical protein